MIPNIFILLLISILCNSKPMTNQSENLAIQPPNYSVTKKNTIFSNQKNRRQLGPIYVESNEFEYDSFPSDFPGDFLETPSRTYAPPFLDKKSKLNFLNSDENVELSAPSSIESISYSTIIEDKFDRKILPNKELIEIAENHIKNQDSSNNPIRERTSKLQQVYNSTHTKHENDPRSSYHAPLSSIYGNQTFTNDTLKKGPPATSYGIPDTKSTPYPPYHLSIPRINFEDNQTKDNKTNGPPPRSYGIPDQKVHPDSINENKSNTSSSFIKITNDEESNGIKTSYGVPLNSVLGLPNTTNYLIENIGIPDKQIDTKFNDQVKPLSNETVNETTEDHVSITTDSTTPNESDDKCCEVEISKSISMFYDLEDDGRLVKRD